MGIQPGDGCAPGADREFTTPSPRQGYDAGMKQTILWSLAALLLLASCAPRAAPLQLNSPEALEVERIANAAWHRMQLVYLETGEYTTNALADLRLPSGVRWLVEAFGGGSYTLRFTSIHVAGVAWFVTPEGVVVRRVS